MESKKEILVVSFGTSIHNSRSVSVGAIESTIQEQFPEWQVRRAFASKFILSTLWKRDKIRIDTVEEALEHALDNGIETLVVQPTYFVKGKEFDELKETVLAFCSRFPKLFLGEPLLSDDCDYRAVVNAYAARLAQYQSQDTAVCFMGHGSSSEANRSYLKMKSFMEELHQNWYVATMQAKPDVWELLEQIEQKGGCKEVVLVPLMVAAGRHALQDMAGDKKGSWRNIFEHAGYAVTCILEGAGQYYDIQQIYVRHIRKTLAADVNIDITV